MKLINSNDEWFPVAPDSQLTLVSDGEKISGSGVSNEYCAAIVREGDSVSLSDFNATELPATEISAMTATISESADTSVTEAESGPFKNGTWQQDTLEGEAVEQEHPLTLTFEDNEFLLGFDGCGHYEANFAVEGEELTIRTMLVTDVACAAPIREIGRDYRSALSQTASYKIDDLTLVLNDAAGAPLATFVSAPAAEMNGTTWFLNFYRGADGVFVPVAQDLPVTITFDGTEINGGTACVVFGAIFTLIGNTMKIDQLAVAPMGAPKTECTTGGAAQVQDAEFLANLDSVTRLQIAGPVLTLDDEQKQLLALFLFSQTLGPEAVAAAVTPAPVEEERLERAAEIVGHVWYYVEQTSSVGTTVIGSPSDFTLAFASDGTMKGA